MALLRFYLRKIRTCFQKMEKKFTLLLISALFVIAPNYEHPTCPSIEAWLNSGKATPGILLPGNKKE